MRHPHDDAVDASSAGTVYDHLKSGDEDLAALQTKPLLRRPLPGQEVLKPT